MKKILFCLLVFLPSLLWAQTINGVVYDEHHQVLPSVSIYLDGTSIGTITDADGNFTLSQPTAINTNLVASFIGYETLFVQNPSEKIRYEFHMKPKAAGLDAVEIVNDGFSREAKIRVFREQFLGITKAGRNCRILNEEDIHFHYDLKTNTLKASSEVPLKIINQYLGYEVDFDIVDFHLQFTAKSVKSDFIRSSFSIGTTVYKELDTKNDYTAHRKKSYLGSSMQFLRTIIHNKWGKQDFELFKDGFPADPQQYFSVAKDGALYTITVTRTSPIKISSDPLVAIPFQAVFGVLFQRGEQSKVVFDKPEFHVDEFGNSDAPYDITFAGEMSIRRVGDLLPMDYKE
jgi:hypothetical protein